MDFLEKDLEQIIYETPNRFLRDAGLNINGRKLRQVRIGNYGIADLITFKRTGLFIEITIFELKNKNVNLDALEQAIRYAKGVEHYLSFRNFNHDIIMNIVLIGKKISDNVIYAPDYFNRLKIYTYELSFTGMNFYDKHGYILVDAGFNNKKIF